MIKKLLGSLAVVVALSSLSSCVSGPNRLYRTWDDWVNQKYTEDAWLHGALLQNVVPVYPIVGYFMAIGDVIVVNPYHFWFHDAWDNVGTGFDHEQLVGAERSVAGYGFKD